MRKLKALLIIALVTASLTGIPARAQSSDSWSHLSGLGGAFYGGTVSISNMGGDIATIDCFCTQFQLYSQIGPNEGIIEIGIDGSFISNDEYNSTYLTGPIYLSPVLPEATHTFQLYVTGTHSGSASDSYGELDYVKVIDGSSTVFVDDTTTGTGLNEVHYLHWDHFPSWEQDFDFTIGSTWTWVSVAQFDQPSGFSFYDAIHDYWKSANATNGGVIPNVPHSIMAISGPVPAVNVDSMSGITDMQIVGNDVDASSLSLEGTVGVLGSSFDTGTIIQASPGTINIYNHFFTEAGPLSGVFSTFVGDITTLNKTFTISHIIFRGWGNNPFLSVPSNTPTPTPSNTSAATTTPTPSQTFTPSETFTPSNTATNTLTPSPTFSPTYTPTSTAIAPLSIATPTSGAANCGVFNACGWFTTPTMLPTGLPATAWFGLSQAQELDFANGAINYYRALNHAYIYASGTSINWVGLLMALISFLLVTSLFISLIRNRFMSK